MAGFHDLSLVDPLVEVGREVGHVTWLRTHRAAVLLAASHAIEVLDGLVGKLVLRVCLPPEVGDAVDFVRNQRVVAEVGVQVHEGNGVHTLDRLFGVVQVVLHLLLTVHAVKLSVKLFLLLVLEVGLGQVQKVLQHWILLAALEASFGCFDGGSVGPLALDDFLHGVRLTSAEILAQSVFRQLFALVAPPVGEVLVVLPASDSLAAVGVVFSA